MKSIIELLADRTQKGELIFDLVKEKINQLLGLENNTFQLGNSASRELEEGSLADLRTKPFVSSDAKIESIRKSLMALQTQGFLRFEEKQEQTGSVTFIITEVADKTILKLDKQYLNELLQTGSLPLESKQIRVALHNVDVTYYTTKSLCKILDYEKKPAQDPFFSKPSSNPNEGMVTIAQLLLNDDLLRATQELINQCLGLNDQNGFQLYLQSSSILYPIDLRVFLRKDSDEVSTIRRKLEGFSAYNKANVYFEEKTGEDSNYSTFIIKEINVDIWKNYLKKKEQTHIPQEEIEQIIEAIKLAIPDSELIQKLFCFDGKNSATKPYPHIRMPYLSRTVMDEVEALIKSRIENAKEIFVFDARPSTEFVMDRSPAFNSEMQYNTIRKTYQYQLIIDIKDLDMLKKNLETPKPAFNI